MDDEFEREYLQLMFEAQGKVAAKTPPVAPSGGGGRHHAAEEEPEGEEGGVQEEASGMAFKMLMKKGGKDDKSKEILVGGELGGILVCGFAPCHLVLPQRQGHRDPGGLLAPCTQPSVFPQPSFTHDHPAASYRTHRPLLPPGALFCPHGCQPEGACRCRGERARRDEAAHAHGQQVGGEGEGRGRHEGYVCVKDGNV